MDKNLFKIVLILKLFFSMNLLTAEEEADPYGLYAQGNYLEAAGQFLNTPGNSSNNKALSRKYYNAARSFQEDYRQNQTTDSLNKAVDLYYRVLQLDKDNDSAAHNLELARLEQVKQSETQKQDGNNKISRMKINSSKIARRTIRSRKKASLKNRRNFPNGMIRTVLNTGKSRNS